MPFKGPFVVYPPEPHHPKDLPVRAMTSAELTGRESPRLLCVDEAAPKQVDGRLRWPGECVPEE